MASLADIRAKYPQYADIEDQALADALYQTHYSDLDRAEFDRIVGVSGGADQPVAPSMPSPSGFGLVPPEPKAIPQSAFQATGAPFGPRDDLPTPDNADAEPFVDLAKRRGQEFAQGASGVIQSVIRARGIDDKTLFDAIQRQAPENVKEAARQVVRFDEILARGVSDDGQSPMTDNERAVYSERLAAAEEAVANWADVAEFGPAFAGNRQPGAERMAEDVQRFTDETFGVPPQDDSFWSKLATGAGSMAAFVVPSVLPGGQIATAQMGADAAKTEAYDRAKADGADERDAQIAASIAGFLGTTEAIPISKALNRLPGQLQDVVLGRIGRALRDAGKGSVEEALQEGGMAIGQNLIAKGIYDPEADVINAEVGEQALIGAILGGFLSGAASTVRRDDETQGGPVNPEGSPVSGGLPAGGGSLPSPAGGRTEAQAIADRVVAKVRKTLPPAPPIEQSPKVEERVEAEPMQFRPVTPQREEPDPLPEVPDAAQGPEQVSGGSAVPASSEAQEVEEGGLSGGPPPRQPDEPTQSPEIAEAEAAVNTEPTEAQKEAGNYAKGHVKVDGFDITIENPKGSTRSGTDRDGNAWEVTLPATYGYIKRTEGADGDQVDVYLGSDPEAGQVFVVNQGDPETGKFDEHKIIMGVADELEARRLYEAGFSDGSGPQRMQSIIPVTREELRGAIKDGDWSKPLGEGEGAMIQNIRSAFIARENGPAEKFEENTRRIRKATRQARKVMGAERVNEILAEVEDQYQATTGRTAGAEGAASPSISDIDPATGRKPTSYIIRDRKTGKAIREVRQRAVAEAVDQKRFSVVPAGQHLQELNDPSTAAYKAVRAPGSGTGFRGGFEAGTQTPPKPPAKSGMTQEEWESLSPGMRREIARDQAKAKDAKPNTKTRPKKKRKPAPKKGEASLVAVQPANPDEVALKPMPNHPPFWRNMQAPAVAAGQAIDVAGKKVRIPRAHKPMTQKRVRLGVEALMGRRVYQNKVRGKTRLGFYSRGTGGIRLKHFDDLEVLAHEMAHWLDFNSTLKGKIHAWRIGIRGAAQKQMESLSYTSDPKEVSTEGFAEFVRLWLTQYDRAKELAPETLRSFNGMLANFPDLKKKMERTRKEMHQYFYQGSLAQARSKVGDDRGRVAATREFVSSRPSERFRQQAVDAIHGIKVAETEVTGKLNEGTQSAYKLMQMVNGAGSLYDMLIHDGTVQIAPDGSFQRRGKGLEEILKPIYKQGNLAFDDWLLYAAGRRAQELKEQGRENLFSDQQIGSMLALERDGFAKAFEDYQVFNSEMLDFYVEMGLLTQDQRDAFGEANQAYIPFFRVAENMENAASGGGARINSKLTGGDRNLRDLAENMVNGLYTNVRAAMVARAKGQLYHTLGKNDLGGKFAVRLEPGSEKVRVHRQDLAKRVAEAMAGAGLGVSRNGMILANPGADSITDTAEIERVLEKSPEMAEFWVHNMPPKTNGTLVDSVIINGERTYFEVVDPVLADALMAHQIREQWFIVRAAIAVRRWVSASITVMPPFFLPNAIRDTLSAATMSDSGFRPVYDTLRGMKSIILKDETWKDWMRNGGGYSAMVQQYGQSHRARAALALPAQRPIDRLMKGLAALEGVASLFENGSRVGEYRRAVERGASRTEAAFRAREISTDFSKSPASHGWATLMQTVPFMNAALQGNDRMMRAFLGDNAGVFNKVSGRALLGRMTNAYGIAIMGFTAALWALNYDDERYEALTPDQKGRFWHVWLPGQDRAIQIPKPYGQGFVFADLIENTLDYVTAREGADTARNLAWAIPHHFWFMEYPGVIGPVIEDWKNETFTGAPVVPFWMQEASPRYQFRESTPELYKIIGDSLNISPLKTQHYARGFFGYMETAVSQASEAMLWDQERFGPRPFAQGIDDYAFRQFRSSPYTVRTKYTEAYYELRARARRAAADIRYAKKDVKRPHMFDELSDDEMAQFLSSLNKRFRAIDKELSGLRGMVDAVKYNPDLSLEEKETQIEAIYKERDRKMTTEYKDIESQVRQLEKATQ